MSTGSKPLQAALPINQLPSGWLPPRHQDRPSQPHEPRQGVSSALTAFITSSIPQDPQSNPFASSTSIHSDSLSSYRRISDTFPTQRPDAPDSAPSGSTSAHSLLINNATSGSVLVELSSWSNGTSVSSEGNNQSLQTSTNLAAFSEIEDPPMRFVQSDLAILSAEQYDDGSHSRQAHGKAPRGQKLVRAKEAPASKKRARSQATVEPAEPEEDKKRSRGRPRLDTKDETAADRRRTQIRLAQRAYRNRKENAIQSLEEKVQGLKDANEQMSTAYKELFDFASRSGLLERAPEFSFQMQKLEALSKKSKETTLKADDEGDSDDAKRQSKSVSLEPATAPEPPTEEVKADVEVPQQLYGGLIVSQEPMTTAETFSSNAYTIMPTAGPEIDYEIVAQPTVENASFPPPNLFDTTLINDWIPPVWASIDPPKSVAYQETTFARRLLRTGLECAARLVLSKNVDPEQFAQVFGFVSLFETFDEIKERTLRQLSMSTDETMYNWKYPFHNLGGAGTHMDINFGFEKPEPWQELSPYRPRHSNGLSVGPMKPQVAMIRDTLLDLQHHINLPGFDGMFWDPDEVEYYLKQNGVEIPPQADYHPVEIAPGAFQGNGHEHQIVQIDNDFGNDSVSSPASTRALSATNDSISMGVASTVSSGMSSQDNITTDAAELEPWKQSTDAFQNSSLAGLPQPDSFFDPALLQSSNDVAHKGKKLGSLDVQAFVNRLIARGVCLGRTPGFRPKDVDEAFWEAVMIIQ